jgi:hypothetical protein
MYGSLVTLLTGGALVLFGSDLGGAVEPGLQPPEKDKSMTEAIEKAQKRVQEELATLKGADGKVQYVEGDVLGRVFPEYLFFSVLYRQFPVAVLPPPPLKGSNVFAVPKGEGKIRLLTDTKELESFFRDALKPVHGADQAKDVARAWLQLSPIFLQDGYYKFSLMDESIRVAEEKTGMKASGKVVVMAGGSGTIDATVTFDDAGKLAAVDQVVKVRRGPRPICQATKLLDPDPIVRGMAEQDLLVIGRAAKPYLDEQRAKATPELQQAIDRIWERICEDDR